MLSPCPAAFILETGAATDANVGGDREPDEGQEEATEPTQAVADVSSPAEQSLLSNQHHDAAVGELDEAVSEPPGPSPRQSGLLQSPWTPQSGVLVLSSSRPKAVQGLNSPASLDDLAHRHEDQTSLRNFDVGPTTGATETVTTPGNSLIVDANGLPRPVLSAREAFLIQHYVAKLAPWIDACDLTNQFAIEVPKRAVHNVMVLYALLSVSSGHLATGNGHESHETSFYHGRCLRLVIEALSAPRSTYDDNLFATVVLLRVYEESEHSTDTYTHISGITRMLEAIPEYAHSGGLAEATSWQALRQETYASLMTGQPPSLNMETYELSPALLFPDDGACANAVVLMFAKIIRLTTTDPSNADAWNLLEDELQLWSERRAQLFQPIYQEEIDMDGGRPCPIICVINAPQGEASMCLPING